MFDASLERLSVTETSYNNSLAERVTRSTIQTLPATLPEPRSEARGPRSVEKTAGARAAIGGVRSSLSGFGRQIVGGTSLTAELGPGFWVTARGSGVWLHGDCNLTKPTLPEPRQTGHPPFKPVHGPRAGAKGLGRWIHLRRVLFGVLWSHGSYIAMQGHRAVE